MYFPNQIFFFASSVRLFLAKDCCCVTFSAYQMYDYFNIISFVTLCFHVALVVCVCVWGGGAFHKVGLNIDGITLE